jgi:adenylosuccinate synthase
VITKLDILSGLDELKVCVGYEIEGERIFHYPTDLRVLAKCTAVYETLPGWQEDIMSARTMADLPENARKYVQYIVDYTETAVSYISVGPERTQIVKVNG